LTGYQKDVFIRVILNYVYSNRKFVEGFLIIGVDCLYIMVIVYCTQNLIFIYLPAPIDTSVHSLEIVVIHMTRLKIVCLMKLWKWIVIKTFYLLYGFSLLAILKLKKGQNNHCSFEIHLKITEHLIYIVHSCLIFWNRLFITNTIRNTCYIKLIYIIVCMIF